MTMKRSLDLIQTIEQPCIDDVQHYVTATIVKMLLKESILFYIFLRIRIVLSFSLAYLMRGALDSVVHPL